MRIENIKLFRFNSKKTRQIRTNIRVANNLIEIAPNTLRIKDLSLPPSPLFISHISNTNPINMIIHPIIVEMKKGRAI